MTAVPFRRCFVSTGFAVPDFKYPSTVIAGLCRVRLRTVTCCCSAPKPFLDPEFLSQIQQVSLTLQRNEELKNELNRQEEELRQHMEPHHPASSRHHAAPHQQLEVINYDDGNPSSWQPQPPPEPQNSQDDGEEGEYKESEVGVWSCDVVGLFVHSSGLG